MKIYHNDQDVQKIKIKTERFKKVARGRYIKINDYFRKLKKCSDLRFYDYSEEQVELLFNGLEKKLFEVKATFKKRLLRKKD